MQARAAAQENHPDRHQDARRENSSRSSSRLDDRYGKIGIRAVAGAVRCKGEQRKANRSRHQPQDSD
jgi:hypothetical protein